VSIYGLLHIHPSLFPQARRFAVLGIAAAAVVQLGKSEVSPSLQFFVASTTVLVLAIELAPHIVRYARRPKE